MKVTLAKDRTINGTPHKAGAVLELPITAETADAWRKAGLIEPANGRTGETATEPPKPTSIKAK